VAAIQRTSTARTTAERLTAILIELGWRMSRSGALLDRDDLEGRTGGDALWYDSSRIHGQAARTPLVTVKTRFQAVQRRGEKRIGLSP